jgi:hypothetical protein
MELQAIENILTRNRRNSLLNQVQPVAKTLAPWAKFLYSICTMISSILYLSTGLERLLRLVYTTSLKVPPPVLSYLHTTELLLIGCFLLLVECNLPALKSAVKVMYSPAARGLVLLGLCIVLYSGGGRNEEGGDRVPGSEFWVGVGLALGVLTVACCGYREKPKTEEDIGDGETATEVSLNINSRGSLAKGTSISL